MVSIAPKQWKPCPMVGCTRRCQTRFLCCWLHWCCLPRVLRERIYSTCAAGMGPTYAAAVAEATEICARKDAARAGLVLDCDGGEL